MRRKNIKIRQFNLNGAKINSVHIARRLADYFATGDSHNNITLYTFSAEESLINFSSSSSANIQTEVAAVAISWEEDIIFSGSNRGIINIWDINSAKNTPVYTLKGHATAVNCFGIFQQEADRLASGSYDTHIKLWDIRNKNNTGMLKHHTKQINCIDISPDNRYLLSSSEDATVKLWDLRYPEKLLATYSEHNGPVLKAKFNPEDCMFASCSVDRTSKYFRCQPNHYNYLSSTQLVSTPITAIDFNLDGRYLCTAGNDILKIWNMNKNGMLLESIESSWRGVHDIMWTQKGLLGLSSTSTALSVWYCDVEKKLKKNNSEMKVEQQQKLPKVFKDSQSMFGSEQKIKNEKNLNREKQLEDVLKNVNYALDLVNDLDQKKQMRQNQKNKEEQSIKIEEERRMKDEIQQQQRRRRQKDLQQQIQREKIRQLERQKQREERQKKEKEQKERERREKLKREKQQEQLKRFSQMERERIERQKFLNQKLQETLEQHGNQQMDATIQNDLLENSSVINISAFMGDGAQKEKLRQIELIGDIMKDSGKYSSVIMNRSNVLKPIVYLWKQGNIESAVRALSQYSPKEKDVSVLADCISAILHNGKFKTAITPEVACILIEKLLQLLQNKHSTYVKSSMYCLNDLVMMFKDELIKVKMFNPMTKGVDFAREERLAKYDKLTDMFLLTFKQERIRKYSAIENKGNEELGRIAKELYKNLEIVLRKIMPKNQPEPA